MDTIELLQLIVNSLNYSVSGNIPSFPFSVYDCAGLPTSVGNIYRPTAITCLLNWLVVWFYKIGWTALLCENMEWERMYT